MKENRPFSTKALAAVLALALWLPGTFAAAATVSGEAAAHAVVPVSMAGAAGVVTVPLNLGAMRLNSTLGAASLKGLPETPAVALSAAMTPAALAPAPALTLPQAVAAHPVVDILNRMQAAGVNLPQTASTPADAAKLVAAAQALPEGPTRSNLLALAAAITAPKGGGAPNLGQVYDNAAKPKEAADAVQAKASVWERLASMPLLRKSAFVQAQADKNQAPAADPQAFQVPVERLRWVPAPDQLPASTKEIAPNEGKIVGQDAALKALRFGLKMPGGSYNVFVSGPNGTGRSTALKAVLAEVAPAMPTPPDLVAVTNFADQDQPRILAMAPGAGTAFAGAVVKFMRGFQAIVPQVFGSGQLAQIKSQLEAQFQEGVEARQKAFDDEVAQIRIGRFGAVVKVAKSEEGLKIMIAPTLEGQPVKPEEIEAKIKSAELTQAEWDQTVAGLQEQSGPLVEKLQEMLQQNQKEMQALQEKVSGLAKGVVISLIKQLGKPVVEAAGGSPEAGAFVKQLLGRVLENYPAFLPREDGEVDPNSSRPLHQANPADMVRVSVLADNSATKGAPVVWEAHPTYENLFGEADDNAQPIIVPGAGLTKAKGLGGPTLKGGSFLRASGGFLVLDAMSVLREPGAWQALMQAVRSGKAEMTTGGLKGLASMEGDKFYAPAKVKIVLIGTPTIKMMLREHDDSFASAFNATAEFESQLPISPESVTGYVGFLKNAVVKSAGAVMDLSRDAISAVLEQSARLVDSNQKLTAQFGALTSLLREASFWAKEAGRQEITGADVAAALSARKERNEGYAKHVMDTYLKDIFHVATSGSEVGQINGLAVMGTFGVPARVTVTASAGQPGVVSVDREAGVTGQSFNKALGVVEGFLRNTFAQKKSLSAHIRISFEQNYGGIDGDSATSTEIYAILSRLSGIPIKQNFAVTGSADQFGNDQAIGGVNEKIEGFFALAKARGLTGEHGIIIPTSNVADLQLSPEVVQAVRDGKFHIYAVDHVSQGIEILTGRPYSEIIRKASARLDELRAGAGK